MKSYLGTPHDFNKLGSCQALKDMSWAKIATYYYDAQQFQFPLTPAEFESNFAATIKLFSLEQNQQCPGRQTNAAIGSSVNEPFVALGAGVIAIGESKSFTAPGETIPRTSGTQPCPPIDGCSLSGGTQAALYWGGSTWQFIANFFQAYRLQIAINRRFLVVDESLFDVGMVPAPAEFVGFGDSVVPTTRYAREVNDVMAGKGLPCIFMPNNITSGSLCVGAPTALAAYGHPRIIGLSNRIFCFNYPLLFLPGMSFDAVFTRVENDCCFLPAMRRNSVFDCSCDTPDASIAPGTVCCTMTIPGGCLSIGLVFKGFALQPAACLSFLNEYCLPGTAYESLYVGNPFIGNMIANPALRANLAGVPGGEQSMQRFLGQPKV